MTFEASSRQSEEYFLEVNSSQDVGMTGAKGGAQDYEPVSTGMPLFREKTISLPRFQSVHTYPMRQKLSKIPRSDVTSYLMSEKPCEVK